jgi:hypothetical protein
MSQSFVKLYESCSHPSGLFGMKTATGRYCSSTTKTINGIWPYQTGRPSKTINLRYTWLSSSVVVRLHRLLIEGKSRLRLASHGCYQGYLRRPHCPRRLRTFLLKRSTKQSHQDGYCILRPKRRTR